MLKRRIFRVILILLMILAAGVIGILHLITTGTASPGPDSAGVKPVFTSKSDLSTEVNQEIQLQIAARKKAVENQLARLNNQQRLLEEKKQRLETRINTELDKINASYQGDVDEKEKAISKDFAAYQERKEEEYRERLLVKKEFYMEKLQGQVSLLKDDFDSKMDIYRGEIEEKYYPDILNINLKLQLLNLTPEEEDRYQQQLAVIKEEQNKLLLEKEGILQQEMQNKISKLEEEYNQEFEDYKEQLEGELRKNLEERRSADNERLADFVEEQQRLMDEELYQKRLELREKSEEDLAYQQELINNIEQEYHQLQSKLFILEKGRDRLR